MNFVDRHTFACTQLFNPWLITMNSVSIPISQACDSLAIVKMSHPEKNHSFPKNVHMCNYLFKPSKKQFIKDYKYLINMKDMCIELDLNGLYLELNIMQWC